MKEYDHSKIEKKWQKEWSDNGVYKTLDSKKAKTKKLKPFYVLDMFPYPSGAGLHVGHPRGYIGSDVYARVKRMQGFNVLHPMGYDAFGLPAEQYAIEHKVHPRKAVEINVKTFEKQLSIIGLSYDWSRRVNTTDPEYYRWTQWIFLQLFNSYYDTKKNKAESIDSLIKTFEKSGNAKVSAHHTCKIIFTAKEWKNFDALKKQEILMNYRLAYEAESEVNWCEGLGTVLANDEIVDDKDGNPVSERGGYKVEKMTIKQWSMRITAYADRLLKGLETLDWSNHIKEIQKNWIGKSEGSIIKFDDLEVFTTRADTLFGVTYIAIHGDKDRFTGRYVTNPANGEKVPVWEAEYVMADYGTGAVMGVPAHDERDFEFAKRNNLPIRYVVENLKVDNTEQSKPREGMPFIERECVDVIVKHWSENKYLCLQWKKVNWRTFVTGGVEQGQTPEEAARMEVREESGYTDLKFIKEVGRYHSKFFHGPKNLNRFAHFHGMYFELQSDEREEMVEEEKEKHELHWVDFKDVKNFIHDEATAIAWNLLNNEPSAFCEDGILANSGEFDGMESEEARKKITEKVGGKIVTKYKMRDAIFARQRYWGEPIPLKRDKNGIISEVKKLPLELPKVTSYEPTGKAEGPLAGVKSWVKEGYETNTMPGWAGSSWYFLRYMDPKNNKSLAGKNEIDYWKNVDMYVGGAEHATGHLLYSRFWHKFLKDIGVAKTEEPFKRMKNQGMILASDNRKMSKRWGNVINPDDIVKSYGADTLRVYEMFMGPFDQSLPWSTESIIGSRRFLEKVWKISFLFDEIKIVKNNTNDVLIKSQKDFVTLLHKTIKKVGEDIENMNFNTSISSMMILVNSMEVNVKAGLVSVDEFKMFLKILAPFAPHFTEEIWHRMGEGKSIHVSGWPKYNPKKIIEESITIAVQVNGKVRTEIEVSPDISEEDVKNIVLSNDIVLNWVDKEKIKRFIYVKGRLVNIVV